jgi:hypothetical protein
MGGDDHRQPVKHASAIGGARVAPRAFVRAARCLHGAVDIGCVAARELREDLAVGWIDDGNGLVACRRHPFVANEMPCLFPCVAPVSMSMLVRRTRIRVGSLRGAAIDDPCGATPVVSLRDSLGLR